MDKLIIELHFESHLRFLVRFYPSIYNCKLKRVYAVAKVVAIYLQNVTPLLSEITTSSSSV
jgi:hypothetical protein